MFTRSNTHFVILDLFWQIVDLKLYFFFRIAKTANEPFLSRSYWARNIISKRLWVNVENDRFEIFEIIIFFQFRCSIESVRRFHWYVGFLFFRICTFGKTVTFVKIFWLIVAMIWNFYLKKPCEFFLDRLKKIHFPQRIDPRMLVLLQLVLIEKICKMMQIPILLKSTIKQFKISIILLNIIKSFCSKKIVRYITLEFYMFDKIVWELLLLLIGNKNVI